jgi:N6-L-threonylcarbamoyladenine synthase
MPSAWTARWRPRWTRRVWGWCVDAIAVTAGPGLIGGVLSGVMTAKGLAMGLGKPLIGVNHLAGHALTPRLTDGARFPYFCCWCPAGIARSCASTTGTPSPGLAGPSTTRRGRPSTRSRASWVCRSPGGPSVEAAARKGDPTRFAFPRPLLDRPGFDMSFSGLKTAVLRARDRLIAGQGGLTEGDRADICAGFQAGRGRCAGHQDGPALEGQPDVTALAVAGGVAANATLARAAGGGGGGAGLPLLAPPLALCTDNAAMIAYAGLLSYEAGVTAT